MNLCLKRKGNFLADWQSTKGMCGTPRFDTDTYVQYNYECIIEADHSELDSNGFLIDQLEVNKYFEVKYKTRKKAQSCERIAIEAVKEIADLLYANGHRKVNRIAVTVAPTGVELASMTCEWEKKRDGIQSEAIDHHKTRWATDAPVAPERPVKFGIFFTHVNGDHERSSHHQLRGEFDSLALAHARIAKYMKAGGIDNQYIVKPLPVKP